MVNRTLVRKILGDEYLGMVEEKTKIINIIIDEDYNSWIELTVRYFHPIPPYRQILIPFDINKYINEGMYNFRCSRDFYNRGTRDHIIHLEVFPTYREEEGNGDNGYLNFEEIKDETAINNDFERRINFEKFSERTNKIRELVNDIISLCYQPNHVTRNPITFYKEFYKYINDTNIFHMERGTSLPANRTWNEKLRHMMQDILNIKKVF